MTGQTDTDKKILRSRRTIHRIGATTTEAMAEGQITKAGTGVQSNRYEKNKFHNIQLGHLAVGTGEKKCVVACSSKIWLAGQNSIKVRGLGTYY